MKSNGGPLTKANTIAPERLRTEPKIFATPCLYFIETVSTLKFHDIFYIELNFVLILFLLYS